MTHTDPGSRGGVGRRESLSARASPLPLPQLDEMTIQLLILRTSLEPLQRAAQAGTEGRDRALRGTDQEVSPKPSSGGGGRPTRGGGALRSLPCGAPWFFRSRSCDPIINHMTVCACESNPMGSHTFNNNKIQCKLIVRDSQIYRLRD